MFSCVNSRLVATVNTGVLTRSFNQCTILGTQSLKCLTSKHHYKLFRNFKFSSVSAHSKCCYSSSSSEIRGLEDNLDKKWQKLEENDVSSVDEQEQDPTEYKIKLTDEQIQELTGGDPEVIKKVNYILLETEVYRQEGLNVPSHIKLVKWRELLQLETPGQRRRYYEFLFKIEMTNLNDKRKKLERTKQRAEELSNLPPPGSVEVYGLSRNAMFLRIYETAMNHFYHTKVVQEMQFGCPLILDCGYDEMMTLREAKNCAKQLSLYITENRTHIQPFNLYFCNAKKDSKLIYELHKIIPTLHDSHYPVNIHEESYLDMFPRKDLVYLTPHAQDELDEFNEDELYIVGAMVDKSDPRPFSLAKAKKDRIRMRKFPLDRYLEWGLGNKSLTLNQVGNILLDLRLTKNWMKALDHVPKRKLRGYQEYVESRSQRESQVLEDYKDKEMLMHRKNYRGFRNKDDKYSYLTSSDSSYKNNYYKNNRNENYNYNNYNKNDRNENYNYNNNNYNNYNKQARRKGPSVKSIMSDD